MVEIPEYKVIDVPGDRQCGISALRLSAELIGVKESIDQALHKLTWTNIPEIIQWTDDCLGAVAIAAGHRLIIYSDDMSTAISYGSIGAERKIFIYYDAGILNGHYKAMHVKNSKIIESLLTMNTVYVDAEEAMSKMIGLHCPTIGTQSAANTDNNGSMKIKRKLDDDDEEFNKKHKPRGNYEESDDWLAYKANMIASAQALAAKKAKARNDADMMSSSQKNIPDNSLSPSSDSETVPGALVNASSSSHTLHLTENISKYVPFDPAKESDFALVNTFQYVPSIVYENPLASIASSSNSMCRLKCMPLCRKVDDTTFVRPKRLNDTTTCVTDSTVSTTIPMKSQTAVSTITETQRIASDTTNNESIAIQRSIWVIILRIVTIGMVLVGFALVIMYFLF